jgi:hypothetical protein
VLFPTCGETLGSSIGLNLRSPVNQVPTPRPGELWFFTISSGAHSNVFCHRPVGANLVFTPPAAPPRAITRLAPTISTVARMERNPRENCRMVNYRHHHVPGGTFFFTATLADRRSRS